MSIPNTTIETLIERLKNLQARYLTTNAVLEDRRKRKEALEAECRSQGIDPTKIPETIQELKAKQQELVEELEEQMNILEQKLNEYNNEAQGN